MTEASHKSWRPLFASREEAGKRLAVALMPWAGRDALVLAIPRGGVEVGAVVAEALGAPLDLVIPRKVGAPGNPELGLGAVAEGVEVLDSRLVDLLGVSQQYLKREIEAQQREVRRRWEAYRRDLPLPRVAGKTAVVVDDGVATGGTAAASLRWAAKQGADRVVFAVPVAPKQAVHRLKEEADELVVLGSPEPFHAVGQWYVEFPQVSDERVLELLSAHSMRP